MEVPAAADGVDAASLNTVKEALMADGAVVEIIAPRGGYVIAENDEQIPVNHSLLTAASVFYDADYVPGGTNSVATLEAEPDAIHFLNEAFKHCKAIAADADAMQVIGATYFGRKLPAERMGAAYKMLRAKKEGTSAGAGGKRRKRWNFVIASRAAATAHLAQKCAYTRK